MWCDPHGLKATRLPRSGLPRLGRNRLPPGVKPRASAMAVKSIGSINFLALSFCR
jgi:hypothetical protein